MREHPRGSTLQRAVAVGSALTLLWSAAAGAASAEDPIREDVQITAQTLHAFEDGREQVSVVAGPVKLTLGRQVLSGRNAVIWTREENEAAPGDRELSIYLEGQAQLAQPGGTVLSDRTMLLTLRQRGRITASAQLVQGRPEDPSLYQRGLASRRKGRLPSPTIPAAPRLLLAAADSRSSTVSDRSTTASAESKAATADRKGQSFTTSGLIRIGQFRTTYLDEERTRRVIIVRGGAYLGIGNPRSDLFVEMRSQSAVLFMEKAVKGDEQQGKAPKLSGLPLTNTMGESDEVPVGVYLEGDVVIARGERYLRGPSAYFDLRTKRAIVVNGVYRTIQEQRGVPVFIRSTEARTLSDKELWFRNARVTTSDFYSPTYHIAAQRAYLKDIAPYDEKGKRTGPERWEVRLWDQTLNVRGLPVAYWPYTSGEFEVGHTALRRIQVGDQGSNFGYGVETQWELFRLLGVPRPKGFRGLAELSQYEHGTLLGANLKYKRPEWSGYTMAFLINDTRGRDEFGDEREDFNVPEWRWRFTHRHKQFLENNWQVQAEVSWISDNTFTEKFFPAEFFAGKEQETLLYGKNQKDNRAFTALLQHRLNSFETQTESWPELEYYLLGEPAAEDYLTTFTETRAGWKRFRPGKETERNPNEDTRVFPRLDAREEINFPLHLGALNVVPYAVVRGTYWDERQTGGEFGRPYGQIGTRADFHLWRVYPDVESRLWDLRGLKHIITPEAGVFGSDTAGTEPEDLIPMDDDIEENIRRQSGYTAGIRQRLQTKRGKPGKREVVDWMRLDVMAGRFRDNSTLPADGRYFFYRPEHSLGRNHVNADYRWRISDHTTFLTDAYYDTKTGTLGRSSASLNVHRSPRMTYFLGLREIEALDSRVATFGANYQLTRKYSLTFFEQYDLAFKDGDNLATRLTLVRKFPRWFMGVTVVFDRDGEGDDVGFYLSLWPEGAPEVKLGSGDRGFFSSSSLN